MNLIMVFARTILVTEITPSELDVRAIYTYNETDFRVRNGTIIVNSAISRNYIALVFFDYIGQ